MEIQSTKPDSMGDDQSPADRPTTDTASESAPERYQK